MSINSYLYENDQLIQFDDHECIQFLTENWSIYVNQAIMILEKTYYEVPPNKEMTVGEWLNYLVLTEIDQGRNPIT